MTSSAPSVRITSLPWDLLRFPPSSLPTTLPPPPESPTFAHPFTIPSNVYNAPLSPNVPITVALVYVSVVTYLNTVNAQRKYKPWAFSKTRLFKIVVATHNIFLAAYSAWTFVGMINALRLSVEDPRAPLGLAGTVDSICKLNGPRGLGDAAIYNATTSAWGFTNRALHLAADGLSPDSTDVGRMWNEGLSFYGWLFYISKFYEVVDTFIILAKGKNSSILQTYHHAGAMLSMWAGIRYMAAPIWMFVLVNSGLHTIMYSYYTLSCLHIGVHPWFKRTLTTLQITQFVIGASYAFAHLFIAYQIPISVPYLYHLGDIVSSSIPNAVTSAASVATATASAGGAAWLKKAAFRAAGREGLAENVLNEQGRTFGIDAVRAAEYIQRKAETRYRDDLQWVRCLDTSGQVFAILLNCLYLLPLTWLFVKFFVTAYSKRQERRRSSSASEMARYASGAGRDALKGVKRQIDEMATEGAVTDEKPETNSSPPDFEDEQERIKNEVGDKSSPDETPELKQDDSFVKVDSQPDSPTEVRSIGDDEEERDAGEDIKGSMEWEAAQGEEASQYNKDTSEETTLSTDYKSTSDGDGEKDTEQASHANTKANSEDIAELATDDAPGAFPDDAAAEAKSEKENLVDESSEALSKPIYEPSEESIESNAKPAGVADENTQPAETVSELLGIGEPDEAGKESETLTDTLFKSGSKRDEHEGMGLFDTETDAKDALPPVEPLEVSDSKSGVESQGESGAESGAASDSEQNTSKGRQEKGLRKNEEEQDTESAPSLTEGSIATKSDVDTEEEQDKVLENTDIQPLVPMGEFASDEDLGIRMPSMS